MKTCKKCNIEKELLEFYKKESNKDGYRNDCKECFKKRSREYSREYHIKNREVRLVNQKTYYSDNKERILERTTSYYYDNKEYLLECSKKYKEINKDKIKENRLINKDRIKEYQKNYRNSSSIRKLSHRIRSLVYKSLKRNGFKKNSNTRKIIGIEFVEFLSYIESRFESWMNWENYGLYNGNINFGWDIDHIMPISSAEKEEDIIKLNHYTNLQPLCSYVNRVIKKDKMNYSE